jgi:hypothetical protein
MSDHRAIVIEELIKSGAFRAPEPEIFADRVACATRQYLDGAISGVEYLACVSGAMGRLEAGEPV